MPTPFTTEKLAPGMFAQGRIAYDAIVTSLLPEALFTSGRGGRIVLPQPSPKDPPRASGCVAACILDGEKKWANKCAREFLERHAAAIGAEPGGFNVSRGAFECLCQPRTGLFFGQQSVVVDLPDIPDESVLEVAAAIDRFKHLSFGMTAARPRPRTVLVGLAASREALLVDCAGQTGE